MCKTKVEYQIKKYFDSISSYRWGESKNSDNVMLSLAMLEYFNAPASTKYHGAYKGGLAEHSLNVTDILIRLTKDNRLEWGDKNSPIIIGLFHDFCKCDMYNIVGTSYNSEGYEVDDIVHNENQKLKGHGDKSVMLASTFMRLTMEEVFCIRYHMYMFEKDIDPSVISNAVKRYPNILFVHLADMLATIQEA